MASAAILINGLPGSGKSTLGVKLAVLLGFPLLSIDAVKERLAEMAREAVPSRALDGIAMDAVWALSAQIDGGVVIDSFWSAERDTEFATLGIARSGATKVVELWCDVPEDVARERYDERQRQPGHESEFGSWADAQPLGLWPVVRVDTASAVDFDELLPELAAVLLG